MKTPGFNGQGGGRVARLREEDRPDAHDLHLERTVLGACILYPEIIVSSEVTASDFYAGAHAIIWSVLLRLVADEGETIDTAKLRGALHDAGTLQAVGGDEYLLALTDGMPTRDVDTRRLRLLARQRRVNEAARGVAHARGDEVTRALARLDVVRRELDLLEQPARSPITWRSTTEIFEPLPPMQWRVEGLHIGPGRPCLLAGYGSSAKTLAAQSLGLAVAAGTDAWNHFTTRCGVVRHLDYEQGWQATARRYQRLALGHGIDRGRLGDRLQVAVLPEVFLDSPNAVEAYTRACDGADLVILDALRGATPTMDENDSSIRVCLDNLTRVSERIGTTFVVLHHAGKPKDGHSDPRTIARGSSAIFDACGCVLVVVAGKTPSDPRKVVEAKPPAEAEGRAIDEFSLVVEDVAVDDNPTGGVRVLYAPLLAEDPLAKNRAAFDADRDRLLRVIREHPGCSFRKLVAEAGMKTQRAQLVAALLEEEGAVRTVEGPRKSRLFYPSVTP